MTNPFVNNAFMASTPRRPTEGELAILQVLWDGGPQSVPDIQRILNQAKPTGYTTVLKLMQIMTTKGLVRRNEEQRAHVYEAQQPAEKTKRQLAADVLQRVFDGSARELMLHALAGHRSSKTEIEDLRRLLDEHERKLR